MFKITYISHDPVAQLGEHHLDRVGVAGSNPVRITIYSNIRVCKATEVEEKIVVEYKPIFLKKAHYLLVDEN